MSSLTTASGIHIAENCDLSSSRRPVEARFEMGQVLLTARIFKVLRQFRFREMARYFALANQLSESIAGNSGEFARLAERQDALRIQRNGKLSP